MFFDFNIISRKGYFMENIVGQPQSIQVPNYSGVNIQIFNPSVATPGSIVQPTAPNSAYATAPFYPANYYTHNFNQTTTNSNNTTNASTAQNVPEAQVADTTGIAKAATLPESVLNQQTNPIMQPAQAPIQNQYIQQNTINPNRKTELREIVELTDDYVKSLENYLNNPDNQIRLIGAKDVLARLQEDDSRKNDPALTALLNKMLQDPYQPIKFIAMGALESRAAKGDSKTVELLQGIQGQGTNMGEDSLKASNVLLKMSSTTTKKEFEVHDKPAKAETKKK